ncbi:hypothetical protein BDN72DRAFT_776950 [Pluteus cervinus]|uniref:Uncharacterized protein n=1 Tax=Pluteus cervinus TaxID=181527 RepID=A0ACD3A9K6_9AGAR|nr:hypothetical protein BDN72DRAFT_776950 [Pluteus cervinus]
MSSPHSLAFSPSTPQPVHIKRLSQSGQLPLPSSLNATSPSRPSTGVTISNGAPGPSTPHTLHTRAPSALSGRTQGDAPQPSSPSMPTFPTLHLSHHTSSTHAGGIQPSASFFRPSRPTQQQYSRPSTASTTDLPNTSDMDVFPLSPMNKNFFHGSDEVLTDGNDLSTEEQPQFIRRMKHSRDPLLPISARQVNGRERSATVTSPAAPHRNSTSRIVRNSLDRVFSLSRGISFESVRKSTSSRTPPGEGRMTFESKDEERGELSSPVAARFDPKHEVALGVSVEGHSPNPSRSSSPDFAVFIPSPYQHDPPLFAVPITNEKAGKLVRNYERHPSRNRFFFGGHILTGGDSPWAFMASFSLILVVAGLWFGSTCVWWWHNLSPALAIIGGYMALLVISSMLASASTDPGILPRNLDPDPPYPANSPSDGGLRAPMPRDLKVRTDVVRVKYCATCKTYRPPRSSHCKMCDNCVDGCDHHCQWINNCVGRRNYTSFFVLLLSTTLTLILIICTSALHLWLLTQREGIDFRHALSEAPGSAIVFCLSIAVIWPVAALLSYHMRLLLLNITTIEQIRNQAHKTLVPGPAPPNPFSYGSWRHNLLAVLCRPGGPSWLNAPGIATEDKREVNPGMLDGLPWDGERGRIP